MTEKTFTQEEVNQIVRERLAQEKSKYDGIISQKEAEYKAKYEEAVTSTKAELIHIKNKKMHETLVSALEEGNALNPEEISKILQNKVRLTDAGDVVMDGPDGQPVPVKEGVRTYLSQNLWAVRNTATGGAGSGREPVHGVRKDQALREAFGLK